MSTEHKIEWKICENDSLAAPARFCIHVYTDKKLKIKKIKIADSCVSCLYTCRIKRDIEQILKELLWTNDADHETTPVKDGNLL